MMGSFDLAFKPEHARRMPEPTHSGVVHYDLLVDARDMPDGVGLNANARIPDIDHGIYNDVRRSLLEPDSSPAPFHTKNQGIRIVASNVRRKADANVYEVTYGDDE